MKKLFIIAFLLLVGCGSDQRREFCGICDSNGPNLVLLIHPPVKESVELELSLNNGEVKKNICYLDNNTSEKRDSTLPLKNNNEKIRFSCTGDMIQEEITSSPKPTVSPSFEPNDLPIILPTHLPQKYTLININKISIFGINEKQITVKLKRLNQDILLQQSFDLSFEKNPICNANEFPMCATKEITLHLSQPTEPTPTPSSTPSP